MASKKIQSVPATRGKSVSASFSSGDSAGIVTRSKAKAISVTQHVTSILTQARRKMFTEGANRLSIWPHWGKKRIPLWRMRETLGVKGGVFRVRRIRENAHSYLFQTLTRAQAHTMDPRLIINRRSLPRHP
ncbi:hypothetical protein L3X38_027694 [Prunus dulcis]|uniref:Uncharacterized protein n=1 Tax=Prunus dulcis TaxID=3755 RepID=A0AAD4YZQ2_PRUDU|nr:hypothetical protein L3X38_027694 [Prunus dulcis]